MTTTAMTGATAQDVYAFPMSFAQQRLWLLDRLNPQSAAYNLFFTARIGMPLNSATLQQSLDALIRRHEILRTIFGVRDGQPVQLVLPAMPVPLAVVDLQHIPQERREGELLRLAKEEVRRPFDLARGPLLRLTLFQLEPAVSLLLLTVHHIVFDGWSASIFFRELAALYQAFADSWPAALPELPVQYADFAIWQREQLQGDVLADHLTYWKKQLEGAPAALELPTDRPRPASSPSRGATLLFGLSRSLTDDLKALSRKEGVSLFTLLVAAFQTLLYRYTGQEDLLLGIEAADRGQAETKGLIGFFVNTLVLRAHLAGESAFRALLGRVQKSLSEAYAHQDLPIEYLVRELQPERAAGQNPFFQVMLSLDPLIAPLASGWKMIPLPLESGAAKFGLSLEMQDRAQGLLTYIEYNTDLFDAATIERLTGHWQTLLEGIVTDPDQHIADLPLLTEAEWRQQVITWNATRAAYPEQQCFHELFEAQVERTPEAVAVICERERLTYRALNQRANQLARYLQAWGVGSESVVPLLAERSIPFLIAMLAVFKAGAAYLPLDPRHPPLRIRHILEHNRARLLLAAKDFSPLLAQAAGETEVLYFEDLHLDGTEAENLPARATPRNLAYVIYTSGSTGLPKGAMLEQRGMVNHLYAKISALDITARDSVAQTASQCFDISVWQFLAALLVGGRTHIFPDSVAHDPMRLLQQVEQHQVSILETVPSLLRVMLESIESGSRAYPRLERLRWLVPTGEALPPEFCRRWLSVYPHIPLLNAYGPTECSDDVTHYPIYAPLADGLVHTPIGRPINNIRLYVLDRQLRPLPVGVNGELYVGGVGVGRGYLNDARRTAEAFVPDPFCDRPGARLYRTGDLVRYLTDGNIEFLGRVDHQVKIRGYRIEPGEIESLLRQHASVQDVVVVVREDSPGNKTLVAYVVTSGGATGDELRAYVKDKLPDYMVPSAFVLLDALPLTPNGKVDRRALPAPDYGRLQQNDDFVAPVSPLQHQLVQIWEELLETRPIGIRDNFFDLGGHSLLVVRLFDRIEQVTGKKLALATLLAGPTIEQLAEALARIDAGNDGAPTGSTAEQAGQRKRASSKREQLLSSLKLIRVKQNKEVI